MIAHDRRIAEKLPVIVSDYMKTLLNDRAVVSDRQRLYGNTSSAIVRFPTLQ